MSTARRCWAPGRAFERRAALATLVTVILLSVAACGSGARRPSTIASARPAPTRSALVTTRRLILRASLTRWRLPAPVYRTVAVALGERIFVFGGHDAAGDTTSDVYVLDLSTRRSRTAGTLAVPTHGAAAAELNGRLLVFGGASTTVHDLVQRFGPARHRASVIARLPGPRADVTAAVVGHTVVLVGGFDGIGPQRDVWASTNGRSWRVIAKLPQAVRYPAAVADGDSVYVFGGLISGGEYDGQFSNLIQRVRIGDRTARVVGHLPTPLAHAMGAVIGGQVLVLGGSTPAGPSAAILRFEPSRRRVVHVGRLPHPLTDAAVASVGDSAYLLGGISTRPLASVIRVSLAPAGSDRGRGF